jgi:hypothetical protein
MADILQEYLSLGLLDIGDDDTRLDKLREASADLQKRFEESPIAALYHALIAYSPNADAEDECFAEDAEALRSHWKTYQNRHSDVPREMFRALSLDAVMAAAERKPEVKASVTYGLRSLEQHPVSTKDSSLLQQLYVKLEQEFEAGAIQAWRINTIDQATVNEEVPRMPVIDKAEVDAGEAIDNLYGWLEPRMASFMSALSQQCGTTINAAKRSELLWWKESMYSPLLNRTYRDLPSGVTAVCMAVDLQKLVGRIAPISVDFFLRETVRSTLAGSSAIPFNELLSQINTGDFVDSLVSGLPSIPARAGIRTLVETLKDDLQSGPLKGQKANRNRSKIEKSKPMDLPSLAVKVYLELQALRIATE